MFKMDRTHIAAMLLTVGWLGLCGPAVAAVRIGGQVQVAGGPVASSTVTLWAASVGEPKQLDQTKTGADGRFGLSTAETPGKDIVLYVVAEGGVATVEQGGGDNPAIALLTMLGNAPPAEVVVNELTTVASTFTAARFIDGEAISGNPLGLRIAAGNVPNLVDPVTGGWGKVILDPLNSTQTTTLANLNTLGSLITAFATVANDDWRARFLKAATPPSGATPKNTLEAMAGIARAPWANASELYALFDEAYPQPKNPLERRKAPFAPYLAYAPKDFALSLCFTGGGNYAAGRLMFDAEGNLWSGQNWLPGSQSGVLHNIGGGTIKFAPNGTPLSPPITGFTGMGVDGIGWGTGVALDKVWVTSFNGKIGVMDFNGNPVGKESDFPTAGKNRRTAGRRHRPERRCLDRRCREGPVAVLPRRTREGRKARASQGAGFALQYRHRRPEPRLGQQRPGLHDCEVPRRRSVKGGVHLSRRDSASAVSPWTRRAMSGQRVS